MGQRYRYLTFVHHVCPGALRASPQHLPVRASRPHDPRIHLPKVPAIRSYERASTCDGQ